MAHLIDLKNHAKKLEPEDGQDLITNSKPRNGESRIISWSGLSHRHPNTRAIIKFSIIFFVIAALIQIFQKNIITTLFFAMIGLVILLNSKRQPKTITFEINSIGILADEREYKYGEIKSFWIEYDLKLGIQELSLQLNKWHAPYIKLPIYRQNPVQLRLTLLEFLPEIEHKDSIVEILSRKLGI